MNKKMATGFLFAATACFAAPRVDQDTVTMTQDQSSRTVSITYTLRDEPGIVTVDIQTNAGNNAWVSIGDENLKGFTGDVNKLITKVGETCSIWWRPDKFWPGQDLQGGITRAVVKAWATNNPPDYAVFDLTIHSNVMFYTSAPALPYDITNDLYKTDCLVMRRVHATGIPWRRGAPFTEEGRRNANDQHIEDPFMCVISADYYLGVFELTVHQHLLISSAVPSGSGLKKPIVTITWNDCRGNSSGDNNWPTQGHAVSPTSIMGKLRGITGQEFDLPTAAQWEFACRAGCTAAYSNGGQSATDGLPTGWFKDNASDVVHEVGERIPNAWGFYDMHGNASEWVLDWVTNFPMNYDPENGPDAVPLDHTYMMSPFRLVKGGGFKQNVSSARSGSVSDWSLATGYTDRPAQIGCRMCLPAVFLY